MSYNILLEHLTGFYFISLVSEVAGNVVFVDIEHAEINFQLIVNLIACSQFSLHTFLGLENLLILRWVEAVAILVYIYCIFVIECAYRLKVGSHRSKYRQFIEWKIHTTKAEA